MYSNHYEKKNHILKTAEQNVFFCLDSEDNIRKDDVDGLPEYAAKVRVHSTCEANNDTLKRLSEI